VVAHVAKLLADDSIIIRAKWPGMVYKQHLYLKLCFEIICILAISDLPNTNIHLALSSIYYWFNIIIDAILSEW